VTRAATRDTRRESQIFFAVSALCVAFMCCRLLEERERQVLYCSASHRRRMSRDAERPALGAAVVLVVFGRRLRLASKPVFVVSHVIEGLAPSAMAATLPE
jgi:hypothetical protein